MGSVGTKGNLTTSSLSMIRLVHKTTSSLEVGKLASLIEGRMQERRQTSRRSEYRITCS